MRIHRRWSSCAIVLAALSVVSCADGQFGQVMQNVGKSMAKGMCAEGRGAVSTAPEFCLYIDDIQVGDRDSRVDVVLKAVNRTGQPLHLGLAQIALSTSNGSGWTFRGTSGMAWANGSSPLSLEPGGEGVFTIGFVNGQWGGADTTLSMNGELGILKIDSRGQPAGWFGAGGPGIAASRGFNFSRVGLMQQQPAQPLQQKSSSATTPTVVQGTSPGTNGAAIPAGTPAVAPLALATASNSVTAIAGSRTWDGLDISGFRIGMMAEEVSQKLKKNDLPLVIQEYHAELSDMPNTKFFSHVIGVSKSRDVIVGELELIAASFAPTPNKSIVGQISRIRRYPNGQQATFQNTNEALMEKYGAPSFKWIGQSVAMFEEWTWVFDRDGVQIAPPSLDRQCHQSLFAGRQFKESASLFNSLSQAMDQCGRVLSVRMQIDKASRVWQLESFMMDNYFVQDALARTTSMVSDFKNKQLEKQIQGAEKQGKPKL